MTTKYGQTRDNYATTTASPYIAGGGSLALAGGAGATLGSLPSGRVWRFTAGHNFRSASEVVLGVFEASGRSGDTLTGVAASAGYSDVDIPSGSQIEIRWTEAHADEIQSALDGKQDAGGALATRSDAAATAGSIFLGSDHRGVPCWKDAGGTVYLLSYALPFSPNSIPGLLAWWDASTGRYQDSPPTTPAGYGDRVRTLVARDGSARAATAPDDASRPVASCGGYYSGPSNGPGLWMQESSAQSLVSTLAVTTPFTIACSGGVSDGKVATPMLIRSTEFSSFVSPDLGVRLPGGDPFNLSTFASIRDRVSWVVRCDGATTSVWANGVNVTTDSSKVGNFGTVAIGGWGGSGLYTDQCIVYGRAISDAEVTAITAYMSEVTTNVICDGNSLTQGLGIDTVSYPIQLGWLMAPADPFVKIRNSGVGNTDTPTRDAAAPTVVDPYYDAAADRNILIYWGFILDGGGDGGDPPAAYAINKTYFEHRRAANPAMKLIVGGMIRNNGNSVTTISGLISADFTAATANPYVWLAGPGITYADMLIKFWLIPELSDENNATYFNVDKTHLTQAGYAVVAAAVRDAIALIP